MLLTKSRIISAAAATLALAALAFAGAPQTISYQGYLKDGAGKPVSVSIPMVFSLYSSGSAQAPVWTEPQTVAVNNGIYSVTLGTAAPFDPSKFSTQLYLGIKVGDDIAELQPRQTLSSAPYALQAGCNPGDLVECYTGPATTRGKGICKTGSRLCGPNGVWAACSGQVLPQVEIANGLDDDCDGVIDNPAPQTDCLPGAVTTCYMGPPGTQGVGICKNGSQTCGSDGFWSPCTGSVLPQLETMNGLDDNCDGVIDNFICTLDLQCFAGQFCNSGSCQAKRLNGAACLGGNQCITGYCTGGFCSSTPGCATAAECGADTTCLPHTCNNSVCGVSYVPAGTVTPIQISGNCQISICDGSGNIVSSIDNSDIPSNGIQCTAATCSNGMVMYSPLTTGTPCSSGVCNGSGACVQCNTAMDCGAGTQCSDATCNNNTCVFINKANGAACNDGNACTQLDTCQAGACTGTPVSCIALDQCHTAGTCNPATGACANFTIPDGTACDDGNSGTNNDVCISGVCRGI